ncbi:MAG: eukaryotic translation initiation factor 2 alpha subunit-domain-containing protein [Olpidium bornovanus]|uniref:Eukaryotic translation initiation factor 2 alpha subunit-domain-containing protein n=1 Tax=Olpidium bornovanus TaxID=278681 RepID=A0A8H7ZRM3_9FUNG|nr:MAG: eukaryotic translation initiation factor 2 alpha subunit-domain-containing protein [Olpidium bornovanus]
MAAEPGKFRPAAGNTTNDRSRRRQQNNSRHLRRARGTRRPSARDFRRDLLFVLNYGRFWGVLRCGGVAVRRSGFSAPISGGSSSVVLPYLRRTAMRSPRRLRVSLAAVRREGSLHIYLGSLQLCSPLKHRQWCHVGLQQTWHAASAHRGCDCLIARVAGGAIEYSCASNHRWLSSRGPNPELRPPRVSNAAGRASARAFAMSSPRFQCRMYEARYPEVDDLVMVNVRQIAEMGAYVRLLEYDNIEGMILLSELSRRRIRSIQKLIRVGRNEVVVVLRVDKEKGYIDLSKRRVTPEDVQKCEERYNKSKAVHSIMRHVAEKTNVDLGALYQQIGWPLYRKYQHCFDAFKLAIMEAEKVLDIDLLLASATSAVGVDREHHLLTNEHVSRELLNNIKRRLTPQPIKIRADIEVACYGYEGIDAVKAALIAGEACSTPEVSIKIRLVAPPFYVMITSSLDKAAGIDILERAIVEVDETARSMGGHLAPRAVSESDDQALAALMADLERENTQVSGDDDDEDDDDDSEPDVDV